MFAALILTLTLLGVQFDTYEDCSIRTSGSVPPALAYVLAAWHQVNDLAGC